MKKTSLIAIMVTSSLLFFSSCSKNNIKPSSKITTEDRALSGFNQISISSALQVIVSFSETEESVRVEANENLHSHIEVEKTGDILEIGLEENTSIDGDAIMRVYVSTPYVDKYFASGASSIVLRDASLSDNVSIDLSGASHFDGDMNAENLNIDLSGASYVQLIGNASSCYADCSGASYINAYGLSIDYLNIDLSGASYAMVTVEGEIDVEASGASFLNYKGSASIRNIELSGASNIRNRN